jgi:hypothetical protein
MGLRSTDDSFHSILPEHEIKEERGQGYGTCAMIFKSMQTLDYWGLFQQANLSTTL